MKTETIALSAIKPYAQNPRINDQAVDKVAASIKEFGFRQPIVVDKDYVIVVGHTRYKAAEQIGLSKVPVHIASELTEEQIRAYRIADNKTNEFASWDEELLQKEIQALQHADFDLDLTGFDFDEIEAFLQGDDEAPYHTEDDEAPSIGSFPPLTKEGELWQLGNHYLLCGDATAAENYPLLLQDKQADMVFTDPPYNVDYTQPTESKAKVLNDSLGKEFPTFLEGVCTNILQYCLGACYICMASSELHSLYHAFVKAGGYWSTFIIWSKNHFSLGRSDYQRQYEPILYGWKEGNKHHWCGDRNQSDVWCYPKPLRNDLHPTMKPVELVERAVANSSKQGNIVLDPFGGSGSTLIACEKTKRHARLMELSPQYCDVIIKRWEEYTGQKAERINN